MSNDPPKVALYTAVYGNYDWIKPAPNVAIPCYLYTDRSAVAQEAERRGWLPVVVPHGIATLNGDPHITAPMLAHKWWKTHPQKAAPDVDVSIWIDGSMEVIVDNYVTRCLDALGTDDWACMPHPARNCIYPEGEFSSTLTWRYDKDSMLNQIEFYRQFHPPGWGLIATGFMVRRHTPQVIELNERWWEEALAWSHQDQLSLPVLLRLRPEVRWNYNLPWHTWWKLWEHGGPVP